MEEGTAWHLLQQVCFIYAGFLKQRLLASLDEVGLVQMHQSSSLHVLHAILFFQQGTSRSTVKKLQLCTHRSPYGTRFVSRQAIDLDLLQETRATRLPKDVVNNGIALAEQSLDRLHPLVLSVFCSLHRHFCAEQKC